MYNFIISLYRSLVVAVSLNIATCQQFENCGKVDTYYSSEKPINNRNMEIFSFFIYNEYSIVMINTLLLYKLFIWVENKQKQNEILTNCNMQILSSEAGC